MTPKRTRSTCEEKAINYFSIRGEIYGYMIADGSLVIYMLMSVMSGHNRDMLIKHDGFWWGFFLLLPAK